MAKFYLCKINNHAVELAENGKYLDAIEVLTYGLKHLKQDIAAEGAEGKEESHFPIPLPKPRNQNDFLFIHQQADNSFHCPCTSHSLPQEASGTTSRTRSRQVRGSTSTMMSFVEQEDTTLEKFFTVVDDAFVYNNFVSIHLTDVNLYPLTAYVFMLMYNIALSYHLAAVIKSTAMKQRLNYRQCEDKGLSSRLFGFSLEFYKCANTLLHDVDFGPEVPFLYSCALVNNMAHAHMSLNDRESADNCFNQLLSILMWIVDGRHYYCNYEEVMAEGGLPSSTSLAGFFCNVSHFILKGSTIAPAA